MKLSKRPVLVIAGAVMIFAVGALLTHKDAPTVATRALSRIGSGLPMADQGAAAVAAPSAPAAVTAAPQPARPSERMARAFFATRDWRAFAMEALKHPSEGGAFYAHYIAAQCSRAVSATLVAEMPGHLAATATATGTLSAGQADEAGRVAGLCAGFAAGEAATLADAAAALPGDPILAAVQDARSALRGSDRSAVRQSLQAVLDLGEPLALAEGAILARAMASDPEARVVHGAYFDGRVYPPDGSVEWSQFTLATELAQCSAGRVCALDESLAIYCMTGGTCARDRVEYLRQKWAVEGGLTPAQFEGVLTLADRMREALTEGRAGAFVRVGP